MYRKPSTIHIFIHHVVEKFPLRIRAIRTDNVRGFQSKFHWHFEDKASTTPTSCLAHRSLRARLNDPHFSDQDEPYQLLDHTDDLQLRQMRAVWEHFYNFLRPHCAFNRKTRTMRCAISYSQTYPTRSPASHHRRHVEFVVTCVLGLLEPCFHEMINDRKCFD